MTEPRDTTDHWYAVRAVFSGGWTPEGSEPAPGSRSYAERITLVAEAHDYAATIEDDYLDAFFDTGLERQGDGEHDPSFARSVSSGSRMIIQKPSGTPCGVSSSVTGPNRSIATQSGSRFG